MMNYDPRPPERRPPSGEPPPPPRLDQLTGPTWAAIAGTLLVVLGSFLPWAKATVIFAGDVSFNGMEGDAGKLTLVGGVLFGLTWFASGLHRPQEATSGVAASAVLAVLTGVYGIYKLVTAHQLIDDLGPEVTDYARVSVGPGLWLIVGGAVVMVIACIARANTSVLRSPPPEPKPPSEPGEPWA